MLGNMIAKPASPSWYSWGGLEEEPLGVTARRRKHEVHSYISYMQHLTRIMEAHEPDYLLWSK